MPIHSKIGASSMSRWMNCPGSVRLSEGITSPESKFAKEGTDAHQVAADTLENYFTMNTKKKIKCSPEVKEAVDVYFDCVKKDYLSKPVESSREHVLIEKSFDLSSLFPGLFGTADCVLYHMKDKLLRVYDYKHGAGIPVEVANNPQLMYYALGALMNCGFSCLMVEIVVVQPRCHHPDGPVRRWKISTLDLLDFSADLKAYALKTEEADAELKMGTWCRFCPAAPAKCPRIQKQALSVAQTEFKPAAHYKPAELAKTLSQLSILENWVKSVREFAYNEALNGTAIPGYKLVEKVARRRWRQDDTKTASDLNAIFDGKILYFDKKLKSPAQVEKILTKDKKHLLDELVIKASSGLALVENSDNRQPANASAKDEFEVVGE